LAAVVFDHDDLLNVTAILAFLFVLNAYDIAASALRLELGVEVEAFLLF